MVPVVVVLLITGDGETAIMAFNTAFVVIAGIPAV